MSEIRNADLAISGAKKIAWVKAYMPLLREIEADFIKNKPFSAKKISISVHLEAKTAYLAQVLKAGGAEVAISGSNPLSTQDDVAAALAQSGVDVFAWYGETEQEYQNHLEKSLEFCPDFIVDDGGDLVQLLHTTKKMYAKNIIGGAEETTTGVLRLKAREREGKLDFPMIAVNDAQCKFLFDNRYGTGQSVWDAIMHTTNLIVAGKTVVVAGYGWCGKGVASKAKGLGAVVIVTEVDAVKAIEAVMDGFSVMTMDQAASIGDVFITVTGNKDVITQKHFEKMKNGALIANAGHFDVEVNVKQLKAMAVLIKDSRENIKGYTLENGRTLHLLAEGRLVNLAAGNGHPAEIMDMSFALQALSLTYLMTHSLASAVYKVPEEIDERVARMKLTSLGCALDTLSQEQIKYLSGWEV